MERPSDVLLRAVCSFGKYANFGLDFRSQLREISNFNAFPLSSWDSTRFMNSLSRIVRAIYPAAVYRFIGSVFPLTLMCCTTFCGHKQVENATSNRGEKQTGVGREAEEVEQPVLRGVNLIKLA